ncbi:major capsid protein [Candidatus Pacearchaeota archaeon]|nr:major capsid protein [Candidatus Pacearchaeota archaeon]
MAVVRSLTNGNKMTDWTEELNEVENQYGLFNGMGLFSGKGIGQTSITFDKSYVDHRLISQSSRKGRTTVRGKDRRQETFSLGIPYFNMKDQITPDDIQGYRQPGTPDGQRTLATAIAEKIEDMRVDADQTREFMKLEAIKGISIDPDGVVLANMFTEFSKTQHVVDFRLGTAATNVGLLIAQLKRHIANNAKVGGAIGRTEIACSPEFFDALTTHPLIREAFLYYTSNVDPNRDSLQTMEKWGVVDRFVFKNMLFYSYDASFPMPDGTTQQAFGTGAVGDLTRQEGYTIVSGMRNTYKAYFGPANTLHGANQVGVEMNMYQYADPKDKYHEMELEMSPLYLLMTPQLSCRVHSSD